MSLLKRVKIALFGHVRRLGFRMGGKLQFCFGCLISFLFQDKMVRKPVDPEEELRWMSQEVRGYVEAVLNSLAANVPKVD